MVAARGQERTGKSESSRGRVVELADESVLLPLRPPAISTYRFAREWRCGNRVRVGVPVLTKVPLTPLMVIVATLLATLRL